MSVNGFAATGEQCFQTYLSRGYSLQSASDACKGRVSNICFDTYISRGHDLSSASESCKGDIGEQCFKTYIEARGQLI
jgi:hypothetical protein